MDPGKCDAWLDHGLLRVTIPRAEHAKPHRIQVQAGEGQRAMPASIGTQGGQSPGTQNQGEQCRVA